MRRFDEAFAWLAAYAPGAAGAAGITDTTVPGSGMGSAAPGPGSYAPSVSLPGGGGGSPPGSPVPGTGGGYGGGPGPGGGGRFPEPPAGGGTGAQTMLLREQNQILLQMAAMARTAPQQTTAGVAQALNGVGRMARVRSLYRTR